MSKKLKVNDLVKNTGIIAIGKMSTQVVSFLLLPVYTAYLTTEDYGIVDLVSVLVQVLLPIITLQLEQAVFRFLIEVRDSVNDIKRVISTTVIYLTIQAILYTCFMLAIGHFIHNQYKYYLFFNLITSMYSYIFTQIARGLGKNGIYSLANFLMSLLNIILNIWFIVGLRSGASGMLLAGCIANLFCAFFVLFSTKIYKFISIHNVSKKTYTEMLHYAVPLIPNQISWWVFSSSDRLIITAMLSVSANGIYAVACKFSTLFTTIYNFFNLSWTEQVVLHQNNDDFENYLEKNIDAAFRFFSGVILGIIAMLPLIFRILINKQYIEAYNQIPILLIGAWFNMIVGLFSTIYIAKGMTKSIAQTSIISALINILINAVFVKTIGLYAASLSTAIAYAFLALYRIYDIKKIVKINLDYKIFAKSVFAFIISISCYYINIFPINIFNMVFVVIFVVAINKSILKGIKDMIKG